jgi:C4-dicarboxylate-specific signal transduction histidine kinase
VRDLSVRTSAEVQRAADIINRIRSMAMRASPEHKVIDVDELVSETMLFLRHELRRNEVKVATRLAEGLPGVFGDAVQLQQVIVNLAVNAMQAMAQHQRGPHELTISTIRVADGGVALAVEDNGPGIADDVFARLFESFFTTKSSGMGIGLPICRSIIEAHGGQITAANRTDAPGARFTIFLPPERSVHPDV